MARKGSPPVGCHWEPNMDFFGQQARARANTKRLVVLFILAVLLTNLAIYLALAGIFRVTHLINN